MKVLFLSNLFPDAENTGRGIYNARLVRHLGNLCDIRVVAPRPTRGVPPFWSPKSCAARPEDARFMPVFPATPYIPKFGSRWNHRLMAHALRPTLEAVRAGFAFDAVLASWIYPDACAVAELSREMGFRFVAIAQGSDVHQYLQIAARRAIIVSSLNRAEAVVTRSEDLKQRLIAVGVPPQKLHTIYNGVEGDVFQPDDRVAARRGLGLSPNATILLFVGNLLPIKNPLLLLDALAELIRTHPDKPYRLLYLGDGDLLPALSRRATLLGLDNRVDCLGRRSPEVVARFMQAADLLCVSSHNEGVPNVVLEALACGLPVVGTHVGGLPEILSDSELGLLVPPNDAHEFARGISTMLGRSVSADRIACCAKRFRWSHTATAYHALLDPQPG